MQRRLAGHGISTNSESKHAVMAPLPSPQAAHGKDSGTSRKYCGSDDLTGKDLMSPETSD
eukprot:1194035-Pyramimonas_sp.AAC.1